MTADDPLAGLDDEQRAAVTAPVGPVAVLAGAGSGKTRVLTRRIAHRCLDGSATANHTLAVTFTTAAAGQLRDRLSAMGVDGVSSGTFHAVAYAMLRHRWRAQRRTPPSVAADRPRLVSAAVDDWAADHRAAPDLAVVEVVGEIDWAKSRALAPPDYPEAAAVDGRCCSVPVEVVADVFDRYQRVLRRRRVIDFDDLLGQCAEAFLADDEFAAAQRWRFRHLLVDEFQDANPLQDQLLAAWVGDGDDVFVVGDDAQSIYGWNGADPGLLPAFAVRAGAHVVRLVTNYRATAPLVEAAGRVHPDADRAPRPARVGLDGPPPIVHEVADADAEAAAIAAALVDGHRAGTPWAEQAVLARTRWPLAAVVEACRAAGVPVRDLTGAGQGVSRGEATRLRASGPSLAAAVAAMARLDPRSPCLSLADHHLALDPTATVDAFLQWAGVASAAAPPPADDAVTLSTVHRAKGLEWDIVHLAGVEDGLFPSARVRTPEQLDEEQRLFYVAVTRPRRELHCWWAAKRRNDSQRSPSPYLERLVAATPAPPLAVSPPAEPETPVDDALLRRLRAWRTGRARMAGVPESVVVPDDALTAIATSRPASLDELAAVTSLDPARLRRWGPLLVAVVQSHD